MSTPTSHVTYPQTAAAPQLLCDLRVPHSFCLPLTHFPTQWSPPPGSPPRPPTSLWLPYVTQRLDSESPLGGGWEVAVHKDQMGSGPLPLLCRWLEKWLKVTELKQKLTNKRLTPPTETDQKISGGDLDFEFSPGQMSTPHFTHKQHLTPWNPHSPVSQNLQSGSSRQSKPGPHPATLLPSPRELSTPLARPRGTPKPAPWTVAPGQRLRKGKVAGALSETGSLGG